MKNKLNQNKLFIIYLLIGILIILYPCISKFINKMNQTYAISKYSDEVRVMNEKEIKDKKEKYEKYNKELQKNKLSNKNVIKKGEFIGSIKIDKVNINLPIYEGTDDKTLLKGIGHLENTSFPTKNGGYHSILVGHTGINSSEYFDNIIKLKKNDSFILTILDESFEYRVIKIKKVLPNQTKDLMVQDNKQLVTLVTCTPKYINSHRLLVTGEKI